MCNMDLVKLKNDEDLVNKHNEHVEKVMMEHPNESKELERFKLKTIFDEFTPYATWASELFRESIKEEQDSNKVTVTDKMIKLMGDSSIYNVYVSDLNPEMMIESLTDFTIKGTHYYGVSDNAEQVLDYLRELDKVNKFKRDEEILVLMTPIFSETEPSHGGWRWHKWGNYIGVQESCQEYIYDEDDIDLVYVFSVYKVIR